MKLLTVFLFLFTLSSVQAIWNGKHEQSGKKQWIVKIKSAQPGGDETCTGVMIGPWTVLTAAHCVSHVSRCDGNLHTSPAAGHSAGNGFREVRTYFRNLAPDRVSEGVIFSDRCIRHPDYVSGLVHNPSDLALIVLHKPRASARPFPYANLVSRRPAEGTAIYLAGYGVTNCCHNYYTAHPGQFSKGFNHMGRVFSDMITVTLGVGETGIYSSIALNGDSGGPLSTLDHKVIGILNRAAENNLRNLRANTYSDLTWGPNIDWLRQMKNTYNLDIPSVF